MRITCTQDHLSRALSTVTRAVGSRPTMPVLANVLLATDGSRLKLSATNLDLGITTWVTANVEEEGTVTVPARLITDLVNSMPMGQSVELCEEEKSRTLTVKCQRSRAQVRGIDPEEFPPLPTAEDQPPVSIDQDLCKELIHQVAFGAARDDTRPVLAGVSLELEDDRITLAASDGFRLVMRDATLDQEAAEPVKVIVPARALQELERVLRAEEQAAKRALDELRRALDELGQALNADESAQAAEQVAEQALDELRQALDERAAKRVVEQALDELRRALDELRRVLGADKRARAARQTAARALQELERVLGDSDGLVEMTVTPNRSQVLFRAGDVYLISRLIEGQFPNVRNFIPKSHTTKVVVGRQVFAAAMRRVTLFARESANVVRLEVEAGANGEGLTPGRLMIEAQAQDLGESHDELDARIEGESTHLAFNAEYLNEFADALAGGTIDPETDKVKEIDKVVVEITGPLSPGVVRGGGLSGYLHVIMPMHTVR